jgi:hypothetical protein
MVVRFMVSAAVVSRLKICRRRVPCTRAKTVENGKIVIQQPMKNQEGCKSVQLRSTYDSLECIGIDHNNVIVVDVSLDYFKVLPSPSS